MAQVNGNNALLTHNGTTIACSTSNGFGMTKELLDTTTKCSSSWAEFISGKKSWTLDIEGVYDESLAENFEELFTDFDGTAASTIRMTFTGSTPSGTWYGGTGFITDLSLTAPQDERVTWSATFTGTAALATASIT